MSDIMNKVIRERQTEARLRPLDMHEIVDLVHELEDQVSKVGQERDALLEIIREAEEHMAAHWGCVENHYGRDPKAPEQSKRHYETWEKFIFVLNKD